jgi:hypothetical protein
VFQSLSALSFSLRQEIELLRTSLNRVAANIGLSCRQKGNALIEEPLVRIPGGLSAILK